MKKIIAIVLILIFLAIMRNIILSIRSLRQHNQELSELKNDLITKQRENQLLKEKLKFVKGDEFVEQEARNKLNMAQNNEYVVFLPAEPKTHTERLKNTTNASNIQKWVELFW